MLLKDMLIADYGNVIDKVVSASTLPKNEASRDKIASIIVHSIKTSGVKEPSHSPLYIMSEAISIYQKSNTWPSKFPEFIDEMVGLTKLAPSTIRSSLHSFPWDVPKYLHPKGRRLPIVPEVTILKEKEIKPSAITCEVKTTPLVTEEVRISSPESSEKVVKLNDNYHVVIDFGAFKITIEKVKS